MSADRIGMSVPWRTSCGYQEEGEIFRVKLLNLLGEAKESLFAFREVLLDK